MKQGMIYKNNQGRYQVQDTRYYFTSGDRMTIYDEDTGTWIDGRVEHGDFNYYWTNDRDTKCLYDGMEVRYEDENSKL